MATDAADPSKGGSAADDRPVLHALIGHDGAKAIVRSALRSGDVDVLLAGPPASGKSVVLTAIEEAIPGAVYLDCKGVSERELREIISNDHPVLLLDELDAMPSDAYEALSTPMEQGRVTKAVRGDRYDVEIDTQFFGACNHPSDLPHHTQDRFRTVEFDEYDRSEFVDVCGLLLPEAVDWVADVDTARSVATQVADSIGSLSPRDARDVAILAGSVDRVPEIARAMQDPTAEIDSDPLTAAELPHRSAGGDTVTEHRELARRMAADLTADELQEIINIWYAIKPDVDPGSVGQPGGGAEPPGEAFPQEGADAEQDPSGDVTAEQVGPVEVRINQAKAAMVADSEGADDQVNSLEEGMEIHFTDADHDAVHAAVAEALDVTPENLYDPEWESDLEGFDLRRSFDISRNKATGDFSSSRFDPSELIASLADSDAGGEIAVTLDTFDYA